MAKKAKKLDKTLDEAISEVKKTDWADPASYKEMDLSEDGDLDEEDAVVHSSQQAEDMARAAVHQLLERFFDSTEDLAMTAYPRPEQIIDASMCAKQTVIGLMGHMVMTNPALALSVLNMTHINRDQTARLKSGEEKSFEEMMKKDVAKAKAAKKAQQHGPGSSTKH